MYIRDEHRGTPVVPGKGSSAPFLASSSRSRDGLDLARERGDWEKESSARGQLVTGEVSRLSKQCQQCQQCPP